MTAGRRRLAPLCALGAAVALATGCSARPASHPARVAGASTNAPATSAVRPLPFGTVSRPGVAATPDRSVATPARPVRLRIPAIGVDTAIGPVGLLRDGSLAAPTRWSEAGWYRGGVAPGQVGPAIIAGHVDSTGGPAVFFRLRLLRAGQLVHVTTSDGSVLNFVVDASRVYPKARFPTSSVYAATPDPELKLITCTGAFDVRTRNYLSNLVVTAHLVGG